ncbi:MAG: ketoacyl-ACP synthase III [Candidatus Marinimicrobia bacterium]|nr:ketoacyl-ACP synthase III [Candidatus Neomarinimicrobiota bacterium]MBT3500842.1 ketoacyl-ACP synthase III [Candidatus Neomarinimicrobiota bacterium]MBT3838876.1 ketoacyl-ACP synthase III [Candidatus Neomarinimicrobiota bacterium]MBT3998853.1 ketoacyl-ACP synthase III [Candidatus Neomarinimicrobiota bacterium]MBT4282828.1 ketoacyl-ACP synthase III [Candidatus Neomarinimicrobiota bacterium]
MNSRITTTAHYVPERVMTNFDLEKMVDTSDEWIRTRTGISQRHIVSENEATSDLSTRVAEQLLEKRGISADEIDIIIIATCTPDHFAPSTAALVQNNIGATNAWGFDLSAACSGYLYALETGNKFISSGQYKKVMVIGVDTMSSILDFTDRDVCVLFGDGAGGAILEPTKSEGGIFDSILLMDGSGGDSLIMPGGGSRMPATIETIKSKQHFLKQDGKKIFKYAVKGMAEVSERILDKNNLTGDDISLFIPHQANKRIIDAAAKRCNISENKVLINIDRFGNTTAGTIPIAMNEAVADGRIKNGDTILLAAFGAGFTWGSMLIKWDSIF